MTTSTLDSPMLSPTSHEDHIEGKSCTVRLVNSIIVNVPPTRLGNEAIAAANEPRRRYASWLTSPVAPLVAVMVAVLSLVAFADAANPVGVLASIVFAVIFLGLALFNLATPDSNQKF